MDTFIWAVQSYDPEVVAVSYQLAHGNGADPLTDPLTLAIAVIFGLFDASHLNGSRIACNEIVTLIVEGVCKAVDPDTGEVLLETARIKRLLAR